MMPSSPPGAPGWDMPPQSPAKSEYSIDLAALGDDGSDDGSAQPLPKQHIDRVLSEEIGGPSDFTLNLEAWMRGDTLKKHSRPVMKDVGVEADMLTPRKDMDEDRTTSHHTPCATPPKESVFDQHEDPPVIDGMSSEWNPYAEGATPPQASLGSHDKHLLQPTVEDYHSELTPAYMLSAQYTRRTGRNSTIQETSPTKSAPSTPGRPSSDTISPVRSPILQRSRPSTSHTQQTSLEQELQSLREKCQQLELLNASLSKAVEHERRLRNEEVTAHETQMQDAARREKDLISMKDEAYKHKEEFRREFSEMRERLQTYEKQQFEGRDGIERLKRDYEGEIKRLKDEGEQEAVELNQEIRALEQDLELARRGRDDAEENAKTLQAELEEYRDEPDAELDRMRRSLREDDGLQTRVTELEHELRNARTENEKLNTAKEAAEERADRVRAELSLLNQTQDDETARLTSDHRRAVSLAEELQVKLKDARRQLKEQQSRHDEELTNLRKSEVPMSSNQQEVDEDESELQHLRTELESKQIALNEAILERDAAKDSLEALVSPQQQQSDQAALNDAILERDAAQDSLQKVQTELEASKAELANLKVEFSDLQAVDSALDARVADAIRKREAYWRRRIEELEDERKFMAKALMRMWGREEVGVEDHQKYAYMFTDRELAA